MQSANDFLVYFDILRKRLWLTVLLFLVTIGVILVTSYTAEPVYRATVRLQVLPTDRSDASLFADQTSGNVISEIQQAQNDFRRALESGFVAWQTIADLNLEIGALDLLDGLKTVVEGDFIVVTVESTDPARAEAIAMTQVNNALKYYRDVRATPSRVLRKFLSEELDSQKQKMVEAEKALLAFKQKHSIDSIVQETQALQDVIRGLKADREQELIAQKRAQVAMDTYLAQAETARERAAEIAEAKEDGEVISPYTKKYFEDLAQQHEATALGYQVERDSHAKSVEMYDELVERRSKELRELIGLYNEFNDLERELSRARDNYEFLWSKENEARLRQLQAERLGYIQITEPARTPDAPVPSKLPQLLVVGGVVSILVGFVLSFLIEFISSLNKAARKRRVS